MSLICPKCQSKMRSFERSGVTVDQCKQCRGVFLDRGELEHLVAAEARFLGLEPLDPSQVAPVRIPDYDAPRRPVSDDRKRSERLFGEDRKLRAKTKKRKKTFLEEFFD
jgi:Zn-finger nucleic acid-binding protein